MARLQACRSSALQEMLRWIAPPTAESPPPNPSHRSPASSAASIWPCVSISTTTRTGTICSRTVAGRWSIVVGRWQARSNAGTFGFWPTSNDQRPASPYPALLLPHHRRTSLALKSLLKFRRVGNYSIGSIFVRRVRVYGGIHAFGFVAGLGAPALPVPDEEALLRSEAIDRIHLLAASLILPQKVCQHQSAQIGHVLAHRQLAVDLDVIHGDILRILV